MTFIAFLYVRFVLALQLLLILSSGFVHLCVAAGTTELFDQLGKPLLWGAFLTLVPALGLAKERNVWRNEFRRCPKWLRVAEMTVMVYGFLVIPIAMVFAVGGAREPELLFESAAPFILGSMTLCIPYFLIRPGSVSASELNERVRRSLGASAICIAFVVAARLGYLAPLKRQ